jgi:hypothetical protein
MSGDVINLRQARKARERKLREKQAAENRVKFGRTKRERGETEAVGELDRSRLDGHRREGDGKSPAEDGDPPQGSEGPGAS